MACMATVEKPGTIRIISAVEEVKEMLETNPLQLAGYAAKMGMEALVKFPDTVNLQSKREFDLWQLFTDIVGGIGGALQLVVQALTSPFSGEAPCKLTGNVKLIDDKSTAIEPSGIGISGKITPITAAHIAA